MHLNGTDPIATNLYSAVTSDDGATKRATDVRKKLMSSTSEIEDELDCGKVPATTGQAYKDTSQSSQEHHHPHQEDDEASSDEDPDDPNPVSLWG